MKDNLVLIGMPGVGKSTAGVVAAKLAGYPFLDSDLVIDVDGQSIEATVQELAKIARNGQTDLKML